MKPSTTLAILTCLALLAVPVVAASDWSQWRGPQRDGSLIEGETLPTSLGGIERSWSVALGKGYPGPIVTSEAVFVVETVDEQTEGVRALDRQTGDLLWQAQWPGKGSVPFFARDNGDWVRSTPAYHDGALYVGGMQEVLHKIDAASGEIVWSVDFPERFETKVPDFGFASSPLVDEENDRTVLYVQGANSIVKLDAGSGETLWRGLTGSGSIMSSGAFSSPIFAEIAGERLLLVQTRTHLNGLSPLDGSVSFSREVPSFRGMNILTPTLWDGAIFTSTYRNKSHLFRPDAETSEEGGLHEIWNHKSAAYMSSPVIVDGHAYMHLGNGRLTCLDLDSGETTWTSTPFGKYWSMVTDGERILALDDGGELILLQANPDQLELLDQREIADQSTWGYLALAQGQLFVRELEALTVWNVGGATQQQTQASPAAVTETAALP